MGSGAMLERSALLPMASSSPPRQRFLVRRAGQCQLFREPLGEGIGLEMVWIPPGRFWMGSPPEESERQESEGPQHLVQLQGFFLGRTPITQAQWREVAGWRPVEGERPWERELKPDPSSFKGDQRPVEQVSWHDAMEFCRRLAQRTGRNYTLPSEAQWEYACRAGTTTPFHFGATISPQLANYNATSSYADGPAGEYRKQTTAVAQLPRQCLGPARHARQCVGMVPGSLARQLCGGGWRSPHGWLCLDQEERRRKSTEAAARRFVGQRPRGLPLGLPRRRPPRTRLRRLWVPRLLPPPGPCS